MKSNIKMHEKIVIFIFAKSFPRWQNIFKVNAKDNKIMRLLRPKLALTTLNLSNFGVPEAHLGPINYKFLNTPL